jgi:gas vesicle protein
LLAGLFIGAAIGLLYAPRAGEKTRKDIRDTAEDLRARGEEWRSAAEDLIARGRKTINEQRGRMSQTID